jgi:trans-2,3-dihydro-3-hydroxyanthranilate isomerase
MARRVAFRLVDVFAERPFAGNQLCVVAEPGPLDDTTMQTLAKEIGFSETTFVTQAAADRYHMRIFTPMAELPFAGHPTLGTAYVLVAEGRVTSPATQTVAAGEFRVDVDVAGHAARMRQRVPVWRPVSAQPAALAASLSLAVADLSEAMPALVADVGIRPMLLPLADTDAVRRAAPNTTLLKQILEASGAHAVYVFATTAEGAKARFFTTSLGMGEDPATGSAAGPVGVYLAERGVGGMPGRIWISQGEEVGRPSRLQVDVARENGSWSVSVGGGVHIVGEGAFTIP